MRRHARHGSSGIKKEPREGGSEYLPQFALRILKPPCGGWDVWNLHKTDVINFPNAPQAKSCRHLRLVASRRRLETPRLPVRITLDRGIGRSRQFHLSENALRELVDHALRLEAAQ